MGAPLLPDAVRGAAMQPELNALLACTPGERRALRHVLAKLLSDPLLRGDVEAALHPIEKIDMHVPARIGDYTDFYVGIHHATNIGRLFRPDNPLLANYKHVPIGYHGRASSIRPSGVPVVRPSGQTKPADKAGPEFGPSRRLDYELELGLWIGQGNPLGTGIPISRAGEHIAGICLLNDWSARDVQAWEYQPLGPFLAKNFHTSISPWIITTDALAPYRLAQPARPQGDPQPLSYLLDTQDQLTGALALELSVWLTTAAMRAQSLPEHRLSIVQATAMYWTPAQIVAHHTSNGCNLNPGDLLGTGTISGPTDGSFGSLMELTAGGAKPLSLPTGETRTFLEDGDEIVLRATASADGRVPLGLGECRAIVRPMAAELPC